MQSASRMWLEHKEGPDCSHVCRAAEDLLFLDDNVWCQHDNDKWHLVTCHRPSVISRPSSGGHMDSGYRNRDDTRWEISGKMTRRQALGVLFILIFTKEPWTVDPLTMGIGKNLYLTQNHDGFFSFKIAMSFSKIETFKELKRNFLRSQAWPLHFPNLVTRLKKGFNQVCCINNQ